MTKSAGPGAVRNAAQRAALSQRWPGVKFAVRSSRGNWSSVTWTDGPTEHAVQTILNAITAPDGYPWGASLSREYSDELVAAACWRAHRDGVRDFYRERDETTGETLPHGVTPLTGSTLATCEEPEQHVDAASLTGDELDAAPAVLAVAGPMGNVPRRRRMQIARTVALHAEAIEGVLAS